MLFVDDDEAEVDERREHRRARADHDAHLAARDGAVGEEPLPRREPGVQHGDLLAGEAPLDARDRLSGEPDLRHEEQDRATGLQCGLRGLEVDLGLAAAGDAVQEHLVTGLRLAQDAVQRAPLFVQQVGDVRERGAGAQAAGLRHGARGGDVRRSALGGAGPLPVARVLAIPGGVQGEDGAAVHQPPQAGGREPAGGAQLSLLESAGIRQESQGRALARAEPRGCLRAAQQRASGRRDADHMHAVGDAEPSLAPVAFGLGAEAAALEPEPGQLAELALTGARGRPPRVRELVLAHDLECAGGRAHERQRGRERREVVLLDPMRHLEQIGRDGRDAQDVAQRQDASLVLCLVADREDHADHRLGAKRHRGQGARQRASGELARDLVVEGLGEGPGADEREDGGVARTATKRAHGAGLRRLTAQAAPPSPRRRRLRP